MPSTETSPYDLDKAGYKFSVNSYEEMMWNYKDHLTIEERQELHIRFWNDMILPELEAVYRTIDPTYGTLIDDPVQKVNVWLQRDKKYRSKVIVEWKRRFATFRYIDGFFYAFRFGSGLILYDCFSFDRWRPEELAFQVQQWIEAIDTSQRSVKRARFLIFGLAAILLVSLLIIFS